MSEPSSTPPPAESTPGSGDDPTPTAAVDPAPRNAAGVPARVGRYTVSGVLGEGAFGRVYRGFDPKLSREVAIKVPHASALTPEVRERFLREARAAATIHHPNVCPIYDVETDGDLPYLVMRFVPGGTLDGVLKGRKRPYTARGAAVIARKIALGVAAAHAQGVLHRDLKPANVLWDESTREVLVTDFGLARIAGAAQISQTGQILGTPAYMSPEQARARQDEIGPLTDVYSLGVILYRLVAGVVPFEGTVLEVLAQAQFDEPRPPSAVRPRLDPRVDALCATAMAKKAEDRYPSAKAFADALADFLRATTPVGAGGPFSLSTAGGTGTPPPPLPPPPPVKEPETRSLGDRAEGSAVARPRSPVKEPETRSPRTNRETPRPAPLQPPDEPESVLRRRKRRARSRRRRLVVALAAVGLVCVAGPVYYLATGNRIGGAASAAELQRDWDDHQHAALGGDPSPFFRERGPVRVQAWEQWARANDPRGMVLYARCLQEGIGTTRDEPAAFSWYRRAAELDEPQAMVRLGDCYANGRGVAKDTGAALDWYRMAAKKTKETPRGR